MTDLHLLGHFCPGTQRYPGPVVPILRRADDLLLAAYRDRRGLELRETDASCLDVAYNSEALTTLAGFDPALNSLFAVTESEIHIYSDDTVRGLFEGLLADSLFSSDNVFFRMSLAKATRNPAVIREELTRCVRHLVYDRKQPGIVDVWYRSEREELNAQKPDLPARWQDLLGL